MPWIKQVGGVLLRVVGTETAARRMLVLLQSEYPPDCDARREFISNFTGSAGTAVVTKDKALLWTDGRYFLQVWRKRMCTYHLISLAALPSSGCSCQQHIML